MPKPGARFGFSMSASNNNLAKTPAKSGARRSKNAKQITSSKKGSGPAYRSAVVEACGKLPVSTVKARRSADGRWEIFVENPRKRIPRSEAKKIKQDALTVLKNFGEATGAPDRKTRTS